MKASEIEGLSIKEIEERLDNEKTFLIRQKLNHAISPLDNPMKIRETKKTIARLCTILKNKKDGEAGKEIEETVDIKGTEEAKAVKEDKEIKGNEEVKEIKEIKGAKEEVKKKKK